MTASIAAIDQAIFNALAALSPDPGPPTDSQPFALVARITEPLDKSNVDTWTAGQWPCALIHYGPSRLVADFETLDGGDWESDETARWTIYYGVADPRDEDAAMQGSTGVPGALTLYGLVKSALNGLRVAGPAATLAFACTGTAGQTDTIDARARIQFTLNGNVIAFQPTTTSVTWDGGGNATINATCVTPGEIGNLPASLAGGVWNAFGPTHATGTISVSSIVTLGQWGTLRSKFATVKDNRIGLSLRGSYVVMAATVEAEIPAEQAPMVDDSRDLASINGNINPTPPQAGGAIQNSPEALVAFAATYTPTAIANCVMWLRPDTNALGLAGSKVATWLDQSGNGNHVAQATDAQRPVYGAASGPNSQPGLTFSGGQILSAAAFNPNTTQLDVFAVVRPNTATAAVLVETSANSSTTNGAFADEYDGTAAKFTAQHHSPGVTPAWASAAITNDTPHIVEFQHDVSVSAGQTHVLVDGVQTGSVTSDTNAVSPFGSQTLNIGARAGLSLPLTGVLAEVIVFSRTLAADERASVTSYLAARYAISVS